jgi:hypothetical protein
MVPSTPQNPAVFSSRINAVSVLTADVDDRLDNTLAELEDLLEDNGMITLEDEAITLDRARLDT